jgi:murein DD-endopeptidase MepM/ murein hydrolase activator NlpD
MKPRALLRSLLRRVPGPRRWPTLARRRPIGAAVVASLLAVACCCGGLLIGGVFAAIGDSVAHNTQLIACGVDLGEGDEAALAALDEEQRANGELIVEVGRSLGVPPRGWVIAVATAAQESSLRNLPHLGADNDHDSLGLFQQRPSQGWGTPEQIMDPVYAATAFYERLLEVEGWQQMPLTRAADAVQRSAYPDAYARHEPLAVALVNVVADGAAAAAGYEIGLRCAFGDEVTAAGWTRPATGPLWSGFRTVNRPDHFGIDIGAARGSPVRAAADGVVTLVACNASYQGQPYSCDVDGSPTVSGCGWYVNIAHGDVITRYCHLLARPEVAVGDPVSAGQVIGLTGSSGHSSGPHLHFEVELMEITDEGSGQVTVTHRLTDPVAFLAARGVGFECVSASADCEPAHGDREWTYRR